MSVARAHDLDAGAPRAVRRPWVWLAAALVVAVIGVIGFLRVGSLGLPKAPPGVTAEQAGLADLDRLRERAAVLEAARTGAPPAVVPAADDALARAAEGLARIRAGDVETGFAVTRAAFEAAPRDLAIGNAFRMAALHLKRAYAADAERGATELERVPAWLAPEPRATLARLHARDPNREVTLQYALAWADDILLYPALEIRAPANVESVKLLGELLQREPAYVPARFGRALGYLHRPARLVWPEARRAPASAASDDLGHAVAIGMKVGGASPRLRGRLALTLGDAFAKEGRYERARSWWQIAENAGDPATRASVQPRYAWSDAEMSQKLEDALDARLLDFDDPLTDLAVMWR